MKKLSILQMEKIEGGNPFWGWGDEYCATDTSCWRTCRRNYYVFWINVDYEITSSGWDMGCLE